MIIAIDGYQNISEELARDLLSDFAVANPIDGFMAPEQETDPDGLANAWKAAESMESADDDSMYDLWVSFSEFTERAEEKVFFCLGVAGIEDEVNSCLELGIQVLDLSLALFPITGKITKDEE